MKTEITIEEIKFLANIPDDLHTPVLRVANGLHHRAKYPKDKIFLLLVKMLHSPKKYALSRNKMTNLAKIAYEYKRNGKEITLTDDGKELLFNEEAVLTLEEKDTQQKHSFLLREDKLHYTIFGKEHIEAGALLQMETAASLPISIAGALMPDAHQGYGLPIGGVLATEADKVIPFAVGVDIACRMCMSVFDLPADYLKREPHFLKKILTENTKFGMGGETTRKYDDSVMDLPEWNSVKIVRNLKDKAYRQLGTSGTGNHFVEWGTVEVFEDDPLLKLPKGTYLSLLSHSGSRGFGGNVANHYSKIAMQKTVLPKPAAHLAWLDLNTQEGQEYWIAMNLAGEYASANHHEIHNKIARELGHKPLRMIENHHNFAWKEQLADGRNVIVHRKGATPAGINELGIIPGSMSQPGYVIRGKGSAEAINSASHGAGRVMSRTKAFSTTTRSEMNKVLEDAGIQLIGGDLDESPMVYKNIDKVIAAQADLVTVLAKFSPKIVRMADANRKEGRED
ncbi:RtcB family protein [Dyadobacter chenwenxiniae]|uniref:3'-phosphate/5'-hydroxy nucleic acid ligase n=1 Tax=Dyadobacter chenwenxiniae TaxID=2906456 RepID=A0A9X1TPG0_9BACT|nr:RtcB family protein [Dyadobacter chenwenxiniae]MCF0065503.1 RtcB family protein [Dyadobacter chenwenxiniae]UON82089.1 RtcB family protein [Dyadobacter chenwenxiniae]